MNDTTQTLPRLFANACCRAPALNELRWVAECSMLRELSLSPHTKSSNKFCRFLSFLCFFVANIRLTSRA